MGKITAEVAADHQHGPVVTVCVGETRVSVYLADETGIVTTPKGQYGVEVSGEWRAVRGQLKVTAEGLHSKSDIAAELAHRDRQIRELSDALTWTAQRLRDVLARRPVRDATECLANADRLTGSNRLSCMNQEDSGNE